MGALDVDPQAAAQRARDLQRAQAEWAEALLSQPPVVPIAAFGEGLAAHAARLQAVKNQVHQVRLAHARRLGDAGAAAEALVGAVSSADVDSGTALAGGR